MLTYREAQTVKQAITETTHSLRIERMARGVYQVRAVDRRTGYPVQVCDFAAWQERRDLAALAADDEDEDDD